MKGSLGLILCAVMCCALMGARAEIRVWSSKDGASNVEASFIRMLGSKVVLEKKDGNSVMVPLKALSVRDQKYVASVVPPKVKIDVDRDVNDIKMSESEWQQNKKQETSIITTIKKVSKSPCTQKLKAELYIVAESKGGDSSKRVIASNIKTFSFEKEDSYTFRTSGTVRNKTSYFSGVSGWEYEGYIVVVYDKDGGIIECETNRSVYESKLTEIKESSGKEFTL